MARGILGAAAHLDGAASFRRSDLLAAWADASAAEREQLRAVVGLVHVVADETEGAL